jgi:hypothetical protein
LVADDRPEYQHGVGTIGGQTFHWGSGTPGKYWSIPYGDYPVTPSAPTGAWAHQAGAIPIANNVIPDPLLGRNRIGIMIHSGSAPSLDQLYTEGCFKVDPQDWPNVRSQILAQADKGPLYLHVAPGGVAAFTNTKTFSQAGEQTPAATANATANTAAAPSAKPAIGTSLTSNPFMASLGQIESSNQNIFSKVDHDYPGQPGSRSQGYYQIDTPTWQQFGAKAGIDLNQYPNAMSAPQSVQAQVASQIPLSRFGARTQQMLAQQYGQLDTSAPIGSLAAKVPGTTVTSTGSAPSAAQPALPAGGAGGAIGAGLAAVGQGTGVDQKGPSPLDQLQKMTNPAPQQQQQQQGAGELQQQMAAGPSARQPQIAAMSQQMMPLLQQHAAQPLTWGSAPYGAQAGLHAAPGTTAYWGGQPIPMSGAVPMPGAPGTTLNSTGGFYGG